MLDLEVQHRQVDPVVVRWHRSVGGLALLRSLWVVNQWVDRLHPLNMASHLLKLCPEEVLQHQHSNNSTDGPLLKQWADRLHPRNMARHLLHRWPEEVPQRHHNSNSTDGALLNQDRRNPRMARHLLHRWPEEVLQRHHSSNSTDSPPLNQDHRNPHMANEVRQDKAPHQLHILEECLLRRSNLLLPHPVELDALLHHLQGEGGRHLHRLPHRDRSFLK